MPKLIVDLRKSKGKKRAPKLPEGGVWRTIRGAKVYIHDGKIIAGAEGRLAGLDKQEIEAIFHARQQKKDYAGIIFEGTEVKVGSERKTGKVVKETKTTYHIEYADGTVRKIAKSKVRRADLSKLRKEEKMTDGGRAELLDSSGKVMGKAKIGKKDANKQAAEDKQAAAERKQAAEFEGAIRDLPVSGIKAPILKRDAHGQPVKERYTDPDTGQEKVRYVYEEYGAATEDDLIRDHIGLILEEIVKPAARRYGLEFLQRQWFDSEGQPTDLFGDLYQEANIGFLYGIREYAFREQKGEEMNFSILAHAVRRAREQVKRRAQNLLQDVPLPRKLLAPLAIINATEEAMTKQLGRKPSDDELLDGIEGIEGLKKNVTFNSLQMKSAPTYDQDKEKMVDGKQITSAHLKLEAIRAAKLVQRAMRLDRVVAGGGDTGDEEIELRDMVEDEQAVGGAALERAAIAKLEEENRHKKLKVAVEKLLLNYLDDRELMVVAKRFGLGGMTRLANMEEVADELGISVPLAKKISASAMKKLAAIPQEVLDIVKKVYIAKSLMKGIYIHKLGEILDKYGLGLGDLEERYVTKRFGTLDEIQKSLDITEFVGSYVELLGSDKVAVNIIEYVLPENYADIMKSENRQKDRAKRNEAIRGYYKKHPEKYNKLASSQLSQFKERYQGKGSIPWSVQLVLDGKGCWITWSGEKIFISGDGNVLYDNDNRLDREEAEERAAEGQEQEEVDYGDSVDFGEMALEEEMGELRDEWMQKNKQGRLVGGFVHNWREKAREQNIFEGVKDKEKKVHPDGWFMAQNPETGVTVVYRVEIVTGDNGKPTTKVTYAFDPNADDRVNIGNWNEIYRYLGYESGNAYEKIVSYANIKGNHKLKVLTEDEFNEMYGKTTEGARELMIHRNFRDITPEIMERRVKNPETGKYEDVELPYEGNRIYETVLPDGRIARFEITPEGRFDDPVMENLIRPVTPIRDANDLFAALQYGIGNEVWITLHSGRGHDLQHHVKLKYDGQGAPVVVGGVFGGMRYQDASEVSDPIQKELSLFKRGRLVRTRIKRSDPEDVEFRIGADVKIKNPQDKRLWMSAKIIGKPSRGSGWVVQLPPYAVERGIVFPNGADQMVLKERDMRKAKEQLVEATEAPTLDIGTGGNLRLSVPPELRAIFQSDYGISLDDRGRAQISLKQFMDIRDSVGSFSITLKAQKFLEEAYSKAVRGDMPSEEELLKMYDPNTVSGYKEDSFLRKTNFYNSQTEGIHHLLTAQKGIAGHGMGAGKTLIGVGASMKLRDQAIKEGRKPGKTLVICPSAIRSEWLKEINRHTDVGAVVLGGNSEDGQLFGYNTGEEDLRSRTVGSGKYDPNHPEHFVVMSYDQFMRNRQKFTEWAKKNGFENIVIDEVHAFKTEDGNRNAALTEVAKHMKHVHALSGTPMDNNVPDIYNLIHSITGGQHDLGTSKEFENNYLYKVGRKIAGMNESKMGELGKKLAKFVHFRNGYDDPITYQDGGGNREKVVFPKVAAPNRYHGNISYAAEYEAMSVADRDSKGNERKDAQGNVISRTFNEPKAHTETQKDFYERYRQMEQKYLTPAAMEVMAEVEASGVERNKSFLPGVQKLQQFANAPLSEQVWRSPILDDKGKPTDKYHRNYDIVDGYKRYYKATEDGKGYERDASGKPVLLPPLHHNNPKADHLKNTIMNYMEGWKKEQEARAEYNRNRPPGAAEKPMYPPKIVITSGYIDYGTEVIANVLEDIKRDSGWDFGSITGDDSGAERNTNVAAFQNNDASSKAAFMIVSDAGKEGINLGNAQMLIHYDQDFNPNKMAQKSARILRSDSWKQAEAQGRANEAHIVSLAMPGTIEDYIFRVQNQKIHAMAQVERAVRASGSGGTAHSGYTRAREGSKKQWAKRAKGAVKTAVDRIKQALDGTREQKAASVKLVILDLDRRYKDGA